LEWSWKKSLETGAWNWSLELRAWNSQLRSWL
jgi:hypothetical protein